MSLERINDYLRAQMGLDPASLGTKSVLVTVTARQRLLGLADVTAYADLLSRSPLEMTNLIDELVVGETWFFRGGEVFAYLTQHIRTGLQNRAVDANFRILCVPCSTGEEPYSLAISLSKSGVAGPKCRIDAIDISGRHLDRARAGCYGAFSFRQTDPELRKRYFRPVDRGWQILESVRSAVHFRQGNLIDPEFLRDERPYGLIFCRNLLIYLHGAARKQVLKTLERLLVPDGLICTGHAEPLTSIDARFRAVGPESYFLFSRSAKVERPTIRALTPRPIAMPAMTRRPMSQSVTVPPVPRTATPGSVIPVSPELTGSIALARMQANAGKLDLALAECQKQLETTGPSAELYSLWGTVHQALGDESEARRCFDKALYLQPDHQESLLQLMLICERDGALDQAAVLRRRFERCASRG